MGKSDTNDTKMGRNAILAVCFLFIISIDDSKAAAAPVVDNSIPVQESPSPSPDPVQLEVDNNKTTSKDQLVGDSKDLIFDNRNSNNANRSNTEASVNEDAKGDEAKSKDEEGKPGLQPEVEETCPKGSAQCTDNESLVTCVLHFDSGSKKLLLLMQNQGDQRLSVDVSGVDSIDNSLIEIRKHQSKKVSLTVGTTTDIILKARHGECLLHLDPPVSQGNVNKNSNNTAKTATVDQPSQNKSDNEEEKNDEAKKDVDAKPGLQTGVRENCPEGSKRCTDSESFGACFLSSDSGSGQVMVLMQNQGDQRLTVNVSGLNSVDDSSIEIRKHQNKKVKFISGTRSEVILNAGHGQCVLHFDPPVSQGNFDDKNSNINDNTGMVGPPSQNKSNGKDGMSDQKKKDGEVKPGIQPQVHENCPEGSRRCTDLGSLVACILGFDSGSKKLLVLMQNQGDQRLSVDVAGLNAVDNSLIEIRKHQSTKVNLTVGAISEVILKAGHGECILHLDPPMSQGNFFLNLPSYEQLRNPINAAYFLIMAVVVFGVTCACCMFKKSRRQGEIPYQEIEMSMPESGAANNGETANRWDEVWDDDWDEENALKSPAQSRAASISANGLTSRTTNKDGWENDWDG